MIQFLNNDITVFGDCFQEEQFLTCNEFFELGQYYKIITRDIPISQIKKIIQTDTKRCLLIKQGILQDNYFLKPWIDTSRLKLDGQHRMIVFEKIFGETFQAPIQIYHPSDLSATQKFYANLTKQQLNHVLQNTFKEGDVENYLKYNLDKAIINILTISSKYNYYVSVKFLAYEEAYGFLVFQINDETCTWSIEQETWIN